MVEDGEHGKIMNKYYISLIPKDNEYGIARNIDESTVPDEIESDWETFATVIGLNDEAEEEEEEETELQMLLKGISDPVKAKAQLRPTAQPTGTPVQTPAKNVVTPAAKPAISAKPAAKPAAPKAEATFDVNAIDKKVEEVTNKPEAKPAKPAVKITIPKEALKEVEAEEETPEVEINTEDPQIAELKAKAAALKGTQAQASKPVVEEKPAAADPSVSNANAALKALLARKKQAQN